MTLIICLLALIVLILLFGAGTVRNGIMAVVFAVVGGGLAVASLVMIANLIGENGIYVIGGFGLVLAFIAALYQAHIKEFGEK